MKPDFFRNFALYKAEHDEDLPLRVAFAGLWTVADREGRFRWRPEELKLDCLPHDDVDFSRVLHALATRHYIVKYRVDDEDFGYIPSWRRHQVVNNREKASEIPEPQQNQEDADASATRASRDTATHVRTSAEGEGELSKETPALPALDRSATSRARTREAGEPDGANGNGLDRDQRAEAERLNAELEQRRQAEGIGGDGPRHVGEVAKGVGDG